MAKRKNNPLQRKKATRKYRDVCWISTEGKTEMDYFGLQAFKESKMAIRFPQNINRSRRDPLAVFRRIENTLKIEDFRKNDVAWIVVDVDSWGDEEFKALLEWKSKDKRYNIAISNPKFELFLLMHFSDTKGCTTSNDIDLKLKQYMPNYKKRIQFTQIKKVHIEQAVKNAENKRMSSSNDIPQPGMTDVYKLVKQLLDM